MQLDIGTMGYKHWKWLYVIGMLWAQRGLTLPVSLSLSLSQAVLSAVCADWRNSWGRCAKRPRPLETRSWRTSLQRVGHAVDSWCDSFS